MELPELFAVGVESIAKKSKQTAERVEETQVQQLSPSVPCLFHPNLSAA
jgi:hypothetical protein